MRFLYSVLIAILMLPGVVKAQSSFDTDGGCLNVISVTSGQGIGKAGDNCFSADYLHEAFINERLTAGAGIGYSYHSNYKLSALPVYLSGRYFFFDSRFSPFINLRVGAFGILSKKNVDTNKQYSVSQKNLDFNLFVSPSIGVKMHITPSFGVMASVSDDVYLLRAYDTDRNDYRAKIVSSWGLSAGVFFQIKGW